MAELYIRIEAVQALVLRGQVLIFDHLLDDRSVLIKWVLGISVHLVLLLQLSIGSLIINKQPIDSFERIQSDLPFVAEDLVLHRHVLNILVCFVEVSLVWHRVLAGIPSVDVLQ